MFEKHDAEHPGKFEGGGLVDVQGGFGWSNGVVLDLICRYQIVQKSRTMSPLLLLVAVVSVLSRVSGETQQSCDSKVFCQGNLLHTVQMAQIYNDSKSFVDLKMLHDEATTLRNFEVFFNDTNRNPTREEVRKFVSENFVDYKEFEDWIPPDFTDSPRFLSRIQDEEVKNFAQAIVNIWPTLARKMKQEVLDTPEYFTLIPVEHGFVVPGGRFREFYYWDSYWIIKGLLLNEMYDTVRGMLDNFLSLVDRYGFVPNGSRIYYLNRSQPPLLCLMISLYIQETNDTTWLANNIKLIDKELRFWLDHRVIDVPKDGVVYRMAHYACESGTPRPESYSEDVYTASYFKDEAEKTQLYADLKSAAESGFDFSSRWIINENGTNIGNLSLLHTRKIIPVDLNSFLCQAFVKISEFYVILHDFENARFWFEQANLLKKAIKEVFYNDEDGIWYDWNVELGQQRDYFYPSNFAPLWSGVYDLADAEILGGRAAKYLVDHCITDYDGGIPTSVVQSGEQWDFPAAWPPLQSIVILGLDQSGNCFAKNISRQLAQKWVTANIIGFNATGTMYEKYDALVPGQYGGGGEYGVQAGFGWTNGVVLELINLVLLVKVTLSECNNPIFCQGDLLRVIQMAGIFKDSKTFVDMSLVSTVDWTLRQFDIMMAKTQGSPTKNDVIEFVQNNFQPSHNELENWFPTDYQVSPPFLRKIKNVKVRNIAKHLLDLWPNLGRKIKPEVQQMPFKYSIIPIPNGFIVPGGRFREFYYWDSYWIIKGLLICDMKHTVKGMLDNFFKVVDMHGFIPNGGRIYYLDRSQPPLLTMMVADFVEVSNDVLWLKKNIKYLEKELKFWLTLKTIQIEKDGKTYHMARYRSLSDTPRPESYIEDIHTASRYRTEEEKRHCYTNIRTGAESGWDFSARWFFDKQGGNRGDLSSINPIRIIPVDLNAFLCRSFLIMHSFYTKFRNKERANYWLQKAKEWQRGIKDLLYNEEDGIWYDFDIELRIQRKHFYPSNFAPLWTGTYDPKDTVKLGTNATSYLHKYEIMKYVGGIPTSMVETGEQWDLPNAWAPLQAIIIFGLEKTEVPEAQELAKKLSDRWLQSLIKVTEDTHEFFEKYNAQLHGMYGGGGEYEVQTGFGWTNGVLLELIDHFFVKKKQEDL
ncbi:trehalase [Asbolus verrucosus]|uniref:Trehalase n=1 Tax=Asbolus verrucosus TaxID=1661398 RepID=A0A482VSF9_ASBVE|nr:trehalase [Asbolus verrucosus]